MYPQVVRASELSRIKDTLKSGDQLRAERERDAADAAVRESLAVERKVSCVVVEVFSESAKRPRAVFSTHT